MMDQALDGGDVAVEDSKGDDDVNTRVDMVDVQNELNEMERNKEDDNVTNRKQKKKNSTQQSRSWYLTALMFVLQIHWVQGEPIAEQIQERVYEKIDSFMTLPVTTLNIFDDFFNKG